MHEDRLPVPTVLAVAGMLGHVGIHHEPMCRRVPEPRGLVGLHVAEGPPAARRTGHVGVNRTVDVGDHCTTPVTGTHRTRHPVILAHPRPPYLDTSGPKPDP